MTKIKERLVLLMINKMLVSKIGSQKILLKRKNIIRVIPTNKYKDCSGLLFPEPQMIAEIILLS